MMSTTLTAYTGAFGKAELLHLLRRTLFGVSISDLNYFSGMTLSQVVNSLLSFSTNVNPPVKGYVRKINGVWDPNYLDPDVAFGQTWVNTVIASGTSPNPTGYRRHSFRSWWTGLMCQQERNIREKMVLFYQHLLVTEISTISPAVLSYRTNKLYRDYALGNYRDLMYDITVDGSMLRYLNGQYNTKWAPDENYGRELQELFCVGKGPGSGYTEDDVKAAARVLTGWRINTGSYSNPQLPQVYFDPNRHDTSDKTFSSFYNNTVITGQSGSTAGATEINDLLDMIFSVDETSKYICRRLYRFFVHHDITNSVETNVIEPLALLFRNNINNPNQMQVVMEALLTSDHFFTADIRGCMLKSPADFVVGAIRQFETPLPAANQVEAQYLIFYYIYYRMRDVGQELGDPPNVAGWPAYYQVPQFYRMWLDSATYPERIEAYERISYYGYRTYGTYDAASTNVIAKPDFVDFVGNFSNPGNPDDLVEEAAELLFAVPISNSVKEQLKTTYLLQGQQSNYYWTSAYQTYVANPSTNDPTAKKVPNMLRDLFISMQSAAEYHLM